ncbi:MAG: hypothetical protein M1824_005694 [Vezdaea acicularis]|nr:MAG: hypothetical protein M1824_005694 [Vezdaea acicularis]
MDNTRAIQYLSALLGKQLRITTTDTRMFIGEMKCTDKEQNVILAKTQEYRHPSPSAVSEVISVDMNQPQSITLNMTSRFLGLVVVPGRYITKIEIEEYPNRVIQSSVKAGG